MRFSLLVAALALAIGSIASAADHKWGLKEGSPDLQSAGQLAFGPDGVLFVGDTKGGAVFAIDTGDAAGSAKAPRNIEKLDAKLNELLGGTATLNDLAVNPASGNIYLSATGPKGAALVKIDAAGKLTQVSLAKVAFQKASLSNLPEDKVVGEAPRARNRRNDAVTDLAYVDGKVYVSGVTGAAGNSTIRELAFPFADKETGTDVQIYHAAHARTEDTAAIRTFIPMNIDGKPVLLAGFTCTPLVRFEIGEGEKGKKVKGTTVAELGNMNSPLDIVAYDKDGKKFLLVIHTKRGVMKVSTEGIGRKDGLTTPVSGGGTAGQTFEKVPELEGAVQLDKVSDTEAVVVFAKDGALTLKTVALP